MAARERGADTARRCTPSAAKRSVTAANRAAIRVAPLVRATIASASSAQRRTPKLSPGGRPRRAPRPGASASVNAGIARPQVAASAPRVASAGRSAGNRAEQIEHGGIAAIEADGWSAPSAGTARPRVEPRLSAPTSAGAPRA